MSKQLINDDTAFILLYHMILEPLKYDMSETVGWVITNIDSLAHSSRILYQVQCIML